nr:hypothetical protein [Tanacetum cinerariifolium]
MSKSSCDSYNVEIKLKRKRHLDTFSSVRRPRHRDVIWKKKGSSNTSNVGLSAIVQIFLWIIDSGCSKHMTDNRALLTNFVEKFLGSDITYLALDNFVTRASKSPFESLSAVSVSNLNKNVKRYSRKDLLACNNSHLGETTSALFCNDAMNVSCNPRMNDLLDDNNFFIFDDVNVRISPVSKMPFRKKPRDSMHVRSKSNMIKSLPRTVHKWLSKLQPLAEPVAKWFPKVKHQIDKISKTPFRMFKAYDG